MAVLSGGKHLAKKINQAIRIAVLIFEAVFETGTEENREPENLDALIEKGLAELPERCQVAVRLRLKENLSNGDIAKRMNITKGTVKNISHTKPMRG
jgi:RNA polymerase sigma factor (sigma-70 family)